MRQLTWGLLWLAWVLPACQTPAPAPTRSPLESWLSRTEGVVAVFPPREDVRAIDAEPLTTAGGQETKPPASAPDFDQDAQ